MIWPPAPNKRYFVGLLVTAAVATCLAFGIEHAAAFRGGFGGFRGGGFHPGGFSGGPRFGDGGGFDRSTDAGFGRGGWGSVHNAGSFSDHADSFQQSHPEAEHNASQFQQSHPDDRQSVSQVQQNRTSEASTLQQNRTSEANTLQQN